MKKKHYPKIGKYVVGVTVNYKDVITDACVCVWDGAGWYDIDGRYIDAPTLYLPTAGLIKKGNFDKAAFFRHLARMKKRKV